MVISTEITKDVFEKYVPAAKMPERNTSVYERMSAAFDRAYDMLVRTVIGSTFADRLEQSAPDKENVKALVCVTAFIQTARSLDLVLTATGFGVVSTESTAPASQARVENLLEQLRLEMYERKETLVDSLCKLEGWGASPCAAQTVSTLFWRHSYMQLTTLEKTSDKWLWALGYAEEASRLLTRETGTEMMAKLLEHERTAGSDTLLLSITAECVRVMATLMSLAGTNTMPQRNVFDGVVRMLEDNADSLPEYKESRIYKARHHEGYRNKKEDPTFFFR